MKKIILISLLVFIPFISFSQVKQNEKYYQEEFAKVINGTTEVYLEDRTRVDIMTETHVFEVDFATKWAESIGQSLHYEEMTNKQAAVLLVMKGEADERFLKRLMRIATKHGIEVWVWNYLDDTHKKVSVKIEYEY